MSALSKLSDLSNFGIGTFYSAPNLLLATGVTPTDKAVESLLQGLVGIALMFLTKAVARFFERKKKPAGADAIPLPVEAPKPIFINAKKQEDGSEKKSDQEESAQARKAQNSETDNP